MRPDMSRFPFTDRELSPRDTEFEEQERVERAEERADSERAEPKPPTD